MAIKFLTTLRNLFGGSPKVGEKPPAPGGAELPSSVSMVAVTEIRGSENAYAPTGWGDTQIESDPWRDTKSESHLEPRTEPPLPSIFYKDVDTSFTALMFGIDTLSHDKSSPAERHIIERLKEAGHGAGDQSLVPRLPMVLPELMRLTRRDDVSPRQLADRLSEDPTLVGEVVRLANSARFRTGRDISNLQEAVMVLGQGGMQQLVASVAMRPIFNKGQGRFSRASGTRLWDLAERCSHACVVLSDRTADLFHAYLAGLVANVGLIAALRVLDLEYQEPHAPDTEEFHQTFRDAAARLSGQIARHWDFPTEVCDAVGQLEAAKPGAAVNSLTLALKVADRASKWHMLAPGLTGAALAGLHDSERRCYTELERAFAS